jgi:hypothetical protein
MQAGSEKAGIPTGRMGRQSHPPIEKGTISIHIQFHSTHYKKNASKNVKNSASAMVYCGAPTMYSRQLCRGRMASYSLIKECLPEPPPSHLSWKEAKEPPTQAQKEDQNRKHSMVQAASSH